MPEFLGNVSAWLWYSLITFWLMVGPLVTVYVFWRVLRDLRRIADALDSANIQRYDGSARESDVLTAVEKMTGRPVRNSAFGR